MAPLVPTLLRLLQLPAALSFSPSSNSHRDHYHAAFAFRSSLPSLRPPRSPRRGRRGRRPLRQAAPCFGTAATIDDDEYNELYDVTNDSPSSSDDSDAGQAEEEVDVDVAIVGAGIGGLCAGAILNTLYGKTVGIYESHYLPGGCAHAFDRVATVPAPSKSETDDSGGGSGGGAGEKKKVVFTFDSGPTIVLGCSRRPYNPLRQVLNAVGLGNEVDWIRYDGWGMIENPAVASGAGGGGDDDEESTLRWKVDLGPDKFEDGPIASFGGPDARSEFDALRVATSGLVSGAVGIPAMAMRPGQTALIPLLRYLPALWELIQQGDELTTGTFDPYMNGPLFTVTDRWLRNWLDALAFSLSGLPASRTSAAAMAYVLYDMHRPGAALDYPRGGLGKVIDALVRGVEQGDQRSRVNLRHTVECIDFTDDGSRAVGVTVVGRGGGRKTVRAKEGVICNAPVWSLNRLVHNEGARRILNDLVDPPVRKDLRVPRQSWVVARDKNDGGSIRIPGRRSMLRTKRPAVNEGDDSSLLAKCDTAEMTGSFLHLHLALNATGLDLDSMEAHYTVMDRGLGGDDAARRERADGNDDGPCGELNMIAVSNPCVIDRSLAPVGFVVVHAYGAGNEPYDVWKGLERNSAEYKRLKEQRAGVLWRAVEAIIPDARDRVILDLVGSPITHERFLRRPRGTYGSATEDYLKDGSTAIDGLVLCGDGVFPGIGVPSVALSGASAANAMVGPFRQWRCLDDLEQRGLL